LRQFLRWRGACCDRPPARSSATALDEACRARPQVTLTVNGQSQTAEVEGRTLLVELLREKLRLTGTHVGCDTSQCGACVVHIDGESVKSCTTLAVMCDGASVTTIEGLAKADGTLHPMQEAFREYHALQCGFCTPGMVMSAIDLVQKNPQGLTEQQIREGLEGNLCRCTGYHNIVKAIAAAAEVMHGRRSEIARAAE
jgi:carbon-monoxide dehydrogenase small subunit